MNSSDLAVLQLLATRGIGPRTVERVLAAAAVHGDRREDLAGAPAADWIRLGLKPAQAEAVRDAREEAERLSELLETHDVVLLVKGEAGYPQKLLRADVKAPPILFVRGSRTLLGRPAVAFCGSRQASERGLNLTRLYAARLAAEGVNIISGYANGVDLTAHAAALAAGGVTTFVLAEGVLRFTPKPEIANLLDEDRHLILSEFGPEQPWSAGNAMQRNGTILGLADAVVVVEAGLSGGTFAAGERALREHRPLFVVDYADPPASAVGNRHFLDKGARPLPADDEAAALREVLNVVRRDERTTEDPSPRAHTAPKQPTLFDLLEDAG